MKSDSGKCYCEVLRRKTPALLEERGIPDGFCGICDFCGDFGHLRHYPGPVPCSGSWCDVCYRVEAHLGPLRETGVWLYDAAHDQETADDRPESFDFAFLKTLVPAIRSRKSALVINHPLNFSVDLRAKTDELCVLTLSDHEKSFYACGELAFGAVETALAAALGKERGRAEFESLGLGFEYFEE